jgi:hypothetical protein
MVELERRGVPTVLFTAQTFVHDAYRSAASFGLAGLPLAVVPLPFTNQKPDERGPGGHGALAHRPPRRPAHEDGRA